MTDDSQYYIYLTRDMSKCKNIARYVTSVYL